MELQKLNKIKELSKFYEILLKFLLRPVNENYKLNQEEIKIFRDEEIYSRFIEDIAGRIILFNEEEFSKKEPIEDIFNRLFQIETSSVTDLKEKMYQIRNCFAHSLTKRVGDKIEFDNGKIKGTIAIKKLPFVNVLYSSIKEGYEAIANEVDIGISFNDVMKNFNVIQRLTELSYFNQKNLLLDRRRKDAIKNPKELDEFLRRTKSRKITTQDVSMQVKLYEWTKPLLSFLPYEEMSQTAINKTIKEMIPQGEDFRVESLERNKDLIKSYIQYIGEDVFYNLDYETQTDIILELIRLTDRETTSYRDNISNFVIPFEKLSRDILDGADTLSFTDYINSSVDMFANNYSKPFMFEAVLNAYMYNRLVYLKELLNTEQIDESILDYSSVDISGIDAKAQYTKKDVKKRKTEIRELIDICKARIESMQNNLEKDKATRAKADNPRNPKREITLSNLDLKIAQRQKTIEEEKELLKSYQEELEYINTKGTIPVKPNGIFRVLRNSTTHGFKILGRENAYRKKDLNELVVFFEDTSPKINVSIKAGRLIKLIQDIERVTIENVERINSSAEPLAEVVDLSRETVSQDSIDSTMESTFDMYRSKMLETLENFEGGNR